MRFQFNFWLNDKQTIDRNLIKEIDTLKSKRRFTQTIRLGLRLALSLRKGDTSVLQKEFPMLFEEIRGSGKATKASVDFELLLDEIRQLKASGSGSPPTPRRATLEDDSELTMTRSKADGRQIALNFVNSLSAVSGVSFGKTEPSEPRQIDMGTLPAPAFDDDNDDLLI